LAHSAALISNSMALRHAPAKAARPCDKSLITLVPDILLVDSGNRVWTTCPRSHSTAQHLGLNPRSLSNRKSNAITTVPHNHETGTTTPSNSEFVPHCLQRQGVPAQFITEMLHPRTRERNIMTFSRQHRQQPRKLVTADINTQSLARNPPLLRTHKAFPVTTPTWYNQSSSSVTKPSTRSADGYSETFLASSNTVNLKFNLSATARWGLRSPKCRRQSPSSTDTDTAQKSLATDQTTFCLLHQKLERNANRYCVICPQSFHRQLPLLPLLYPNVLLLICLFLHPPQKKNDYVIFNMLS